jgi:Second Messenger Oligonucleotide or Dinucleotide Synthetase domain
MMLTTQHNSMIQPLNLNRNGLLNKLAEQLDMPAYLEALARQKYQEISEWLGAEGSSLRSYSPKLYPQGSFRLGTIIRPIADNDDFDIDLVCCLSLCKDDVTQAQLKAMVGDRLREKYKANLEEGRRCWTLVFDGFHVDILPAIPNPNAIPSGIQITDMELFRWQMSNPIEYSKWFKKRQILRIVLERSMAAGVDIEAIPEYQVHTPLQRAVQLLKRHRDLAFANDPDDQPISIIITTLAAKAYENEADIETTLSKLAANMGKHIENRNGVDWVANPTDENENFADKWVQYPQRKHKFLQWLERLNTEINTSANTVGIHALSESLERSFGGTLMEKAIQSFGNGARIIREQGQLQMTPGTGQLVTATATAVASAAPRPATIPVQRHQFYGDEA